MMFGSFFLIILLGAGFWWLMQQQGGSGMPPLGPRREDPLEIAKMRYARGEIDKEEYQEIRSRLLSS
jgi:uncharacterized membrane protein